MALLEDANVALKLMKRSFFRKTANELGHMIRSKQLKLSKMTMKATQNVQIPKTQTEV